MKRLSKRFRCQAASISNRIRLNICLGDQISPDNTSSSIRLVDMQVRTQESKSNDSATVQRAKPEIETDEFEITRGKKDFFRKRK